LLRGQSRPIPIHRLRDGRRRAPRVGRGIPLIGRDMERCRLAEVIHRTARTGRGGAVLLRGEAGVGKSRLFSEMEAEARAAGFGWVWIDNPPHRMGAPYFAVRTMIEALADELGVRAGILARQTVGSEMDDETARLLFGAVTVMARNTDLLLLAEEGWDQRFTGLSDPAELATGLRLAVQWFVSGLVAIQPRCFVVDDYHWMDPSSQFDADGDDSAGRRTPACRPDSDAAAAHARMGEPVPRRRDRAGRSGRDRYGGAGQGGGGAKLESDSARWLFRRTAGNALFIGEIMRTLRVGGRTEQVGDRLRIDRAAAQRSVPLSLRALLGAQIDALPPGPRAALEVAAVIGVRFDEWLLRELQDGPIDAPISTSWRRPAS